MTRPELLLGSTCSVNGCEAFIIMLSGCATEDILCGLHAEVLFHNFMQTILCTHSISMHIKAESITQNGCSVQGMATSIQTSPPSDIQPLGTGVEKETDDDNTPPDVYLASLAEDTGPDSTVLYGSW